MRGGLSSDGMHMGESGLVVSAIGSGGRAIVFTCTDSNGAFRLDAPADPIGNETRQFVTLLVSDSWQAILYRGTEVFPVEGSKPEHHRTGHL